MALSASLPSIYKITWSITWSGSPMEKTTGELPDTYVGLDTALKAALAWEEKMSEEDRAPQPRNRSLEAKGFAVEGSPRGARECRTDVLRISPPTYPTMRRFP